MAKTKVPQNLGYFFFCQGNCAVANAWNVDPAIPHTPEANVYIASMPLHIRRFCAQEKIGLDVLARYLHLTVQADAPLRDVKPGDVFHLVAVIHNPNKLVTTVTPKRPSPATCR